jgi:hypothetical protein
VERLRQPATFNEDCTREFPHVQTAHHRGSIEPIIKASVQDDPLPPGEGAAKRRVRAGKPKRFGSPALIRRWRHLLPEGEGARPIQFPLPRRVPRELGGETAPKAQTGCVPEAATTQPCNVRLGEPPRRGCRRATRLT